MSRRRRLALSGVSFVFLVVGVNAFVATVFDQASFAMARTVNANDRVLIDKVGYHLDGLHRGDIVLVSPPGPDGDGAELQRVVGLPGDRMSCAGGLMFRDGITIPDVSGRPERTCAPVSIGSGQIYVVGDNSGLARDSRSFGAVPASAVIGRAVAIVWPLR